jgi:hypothetical protein
MVIGRGSPDDEAGLNCRRGDGVCGHADEKRSDWKRAGDREKEERSKGEVSPAGGGAERGGAAKEPRPKRVMRFDRSLSQASEAALMR